MEIILVLVAFALGWFLRGMSLMNAMFKNPDKMIDLLQQYKEVKDSDDDEPVSKTDEILLDIQREQGNYYAYSSQGQFLAQGADFRSMFQSIKDRYPNKQFRIDKYQPNLTEEETGRLVKSVFEVFKSDKSN
jgi:hypothetical protein